MSQCDALLAGASEGVAAALRAVDCLSAETTASAFTRLFGTSGALMPALTLLLTLYIAFFAFSLLAGRSSLGIGALTPRMLTVGLVLTFATSWIAYQSVVWNLATGAPDQIAGILLGTNGSATQLFADRIDLIFNAIAETASPAAQTAAPAKAGANQGSFTPTNLTWLAALLLMLGTVGILVTARIALAVLLSIGPVFVTLLLFNGTRGLFSGWLRSVVLTAITPMFAILGGSFMVELVVPVVAGLRGAEGIDGRAAMALFVMAAVHCALMLLAIRVASTMVGAWTVFGLAGQGDDIQRESPASSATAQLPAQLIQTQNAAASDRVRTMISLAPSTSATAPAPPAGAAAYQQPLGSRVVTMVQGHHASLSLPPLRARGIGSRFANKTTAPKELLK